MNGYVISQETNASSNNQRDIPSADGQYKITLENEVMTVNGDKYTLDKQGSAIRIENDKVEINGIDSSPDT